MEPLPEKITIGDKYGPAMKITEFAEAAAYFERCVAHCMTFGRTREEAESIEKQNLGYYAGYYDNETRERVERLFQCAHPIFGPISEVMQAVTKAYGLLWLFQGNSDDPNIRLVHQARVLLRDTLMRDELRNGIEFAKEHTKDWGLDLQNWM